MEQLFITNLWLNPRMFFISAFWIVFAICCHEFCHAYVAVRYGDPTPAETGHLTFNPLRQMGWTSLLTFCICGLAWGQVPVDPHKMRGRFAPALVALAGPLCNLLLSQLALILAVVLYSCGVIPDDGANMLLYGAMLNLVLGVANLLPIPGLDGWAILTNFLPALGKSSSEFLGGAAFLLIALFFFAFPKLVTLAWIALGYEVLGLRLLKGLLL